MKTAVDAVFAWGHGGKDRAYNRRFAQMCAHHLVEPVACSPTAGWEKGQVENQVGVIRQRMFTPWLRFKSYEELNAWLIDQCVVWAPMLQEGGHSPIPRFATARSGRCHPTRSGSHRHPGCSRPNGRA